MHVLILLEKFLAGGVESHVKNQASILRKLGAKITIMASHVNDRARDEVKHFKLSKDMRAGEFCSELDKLNAYVKENNVTHIHCHSPFIAIMGACVSDEAGIPLLLTVHGLFDVRRRINPTIGLLISKIGYPSAVKILPVSPGLAEEIKKEHGIERAQQDVMMNAVENWRPSTGVNAEKGSWVFVSRLEKTHVDALSHLVSAMPDLPISNLHIFGDGSHYERAVDLSAGKKIFFHGFVEDAAEKLSTFEGVVCYGGRSFLEAIAAGRPCLICHETGLIGLCSPTVIDATKDENFTGRGQKVLSAKDIMADWDQMTDHDNIRSCQVLISQHHDSHKVWKKYYDNYLDSKSSSKDVPFIKIFVASARKLPAKNMIFSQHDLLVRLRNSLPNDSDIVHEVNRVGFDVMNSTLTIIRRKNRNSQSST